MKHILSFLFALSVSFAGVAHASWIHKYDCIRTGTDDYYQLWVNDDGSVGFEYTDPDKGGWEGNRVYPSATEETPRIANARHFGFSGKEIFVQSSLLEGQLPGSVQISDEHYLRATFRCIRPN